MLLKTLMCRYSLMEKLVDCLDPNRGNDWFPLPFLQAMQCIGMQHPASWLQFPETGLSINKKPDHFLKRTRHTDVPCVTASCHVRVRLDSFSSALEPNEGKHKNLREKAKANQPTNQPKILHKNHSKASFPLHLFFPEFEYHPSGEPWLEPRFHQTQLNGKKHLLSSSQ